ncbi:MAG TPA: arylsulfotransferase family protein [Thermoanaerobaculia bacterium]
MRRGNLTDSTRASEAPRGSASCGFATALCTWRPFLCALGLCLLSACGPGTPEAVGGGATRAAPDRREGVEAKSRDENDALAALEALPYLTWNERADPSVRGVTRHLPELAWDGLNLYTNDVDAAYLVDMDGRRLHEWKLPAGSKHCEHVELLAGGNLLAVCVYQWLTRVSWNSDVRWLLKQSVHHDAHVMDDGTAIVPFGAGAREYRGRRVTFDGLLWVSPDGEIRKRWSSFDALDELRRHHPASRLDEAAAAADPERRFDYYHLNSVQALPETPLGAADRRFRAGNLLLCLRNVDTILILDQDTMAVTWSWGGGELEFPHMPRMLPNGNILVFDNGVKRRFSRVLELDPARERIVWSYPADPAGEFFSAWRGSAQRLPNGNTLICESETGRALEVTSEGRIVWEFWNPDLRDGKRRRMYRFLRLERETVVRLLLRGRAAG